jgi:F-type H+-transporting ATPase subunit epsilon
VSDDLQVSVIAPDRVGYEGPAESVVAPAHDGQLGILAGHAPMTVLLGEGELRVRSDDGTRRFRVARGFLQVVENEVSVLAEEVEEV